ncbi:MAG: energy transducer TonB, partial [Ignavibacteria bacterium]|nr:energy transducer TonB [Ignavibacteria bacterium]
VWVKILVSKEGKPKKAVVVKSDAEIFNQSATDAAMKYSFTPALQNNKPVAVWVVVPFKFELRGN